MRRACTARRPVGANAAWQRYAVAAPGNWVWVYGLIAILKPGHQETWPVTWVLVEEVHSGDWGIAGNGLTTADVHALQAQPAAAAVG